MIKVDIVNEVSKIADITKVKAEVAVDAVFDAMRLSMQRGERIELRGFGVFQVKPRKRGIGRNPADRQGSPDPAGPHDPLQARQGPPEHRRLIALSARRAGASVRWRPTPLDRSDGRTRSSRSARPVASSATAGGCTSSCSCSRCCSRRRSARFIISRSSPSSAGGRCRSPGDRWSTASGTA